MDSVQKRDRDRKRRQQAEEEEQRRRQRVAERQGKGHDTGRPSYSSAPAPVVQPSSVPMRARSLPALPVPSGPTTGPSTRAVSSIPAPAPKVVPAKPSAPPSAPKAPSAESSKPKPPTPPA